MYAVAKEHRSTKLLTKVRRAPTLDKFDGPINKRDSLELNEICTTIKKPMVNSKTKLFRQSHQEYHDEEISAQHQDMIRYINNSWRGIQQELEYSHNYNKIASITNGDNNQIKINNNAKIKHINGCTTSSIPKNFVPFDLETFFGQRFIQKLLQS